eukprot:SAG31_NODE_14026_length_831_cov_0.829235_1_plen_153_part_01
MPERNQIRIRWEQNGRMATIDLRLHHVKILSEQHMDYCVLCHKESDPVRGPLILCEGGDPKCPHAMHMSCAKLTQQQVDDPEFLWRCDKGLCKRSQKRKNEGKKAPATEIKKIRPCPPLPERAELSAQGSPSPQVVEGEELTPEEEMAQAAID